jgi:glutathione peroxidase
VGWNFQKYVVDRTGQLVARFDPRTKPQDTKLTEIIDAALSFTARGSSRSAKILGL